MADELDALLDKIDDPGLRAELHSHIDKLRRRRTFGLVFEDHLPERVRLPEHPIRRGVRVVRRDDHDDLVGGVGGQLHGAERTTNDLDAVVRYGRDNLERLVTAMRELGARIRAEGFADYLAKEAAGGDAPHRHVHPR